LVSSMRGKLLLSMGVIAVAAVTLIWFQPQKLLIDQEIDEALPGQSAAVTDDAGDKHAADSKANAPGAKPSIATLGAGSFRALAHPVSGRAKLLELRNGDLYLRFENFKVENGPDLRVYVARATAASDASAFGRDFIDLGALKGNVGDQNYRIPAGTARGALTSAVIWCRRFSVGFAVASIGNG
jgi:hypothetical protein